MVLRAVTGVLFCCYFLLFSQYALSSENICNKAETYKCEVYQTCCQFGDGNYGCCPYPYANCCQDTNACCQSGFACQSNGTGCVRMDV